MPTSLTTQRLALRRLDSTHRDLVHRLFSDPGHSVGEGPLTDLTETERWLARRQVTYDVSGYAWYGLWFPTGEFIGTCGVLLSDRCAPEPELGYEVATEMRGRGFAREAAAAVTAAAHDSGVTRLWATVRTANEASLRVLRSLAYAHVRTETDERGELAYYVSDRSVG